MGHEPGERVNCVCSHDAVRVLHRSAAQPVTDPVADDAADAPSEPQPCLSASAAGARLSSRSANRIAMS